MGTTGRPCPRADRARQGAVRPRGCAAGSPRRSRGPSSSASTGPAVGGDAGRDRRRASAGPSSVRPSAAGGISTNRDAVVREEEHRGPCRRRRSGACRRACAGSCSAAPTSARRRQLEQVGEQRLLVVDVQDGVADHAPHRARGRSAPGMARWSPSTGGRSRRRGGRDRPTPTPRSRRGRTRRSSGSRSGRRCTTARSGRSDGCRAPRCTGCPDRQPRFSAQR